MGLNEIMMIMSYHIIWICYGAPPICSSESEAPYKMK